MKIKICKQTGAFLRLRMSRAEHLSVDHEGVGNTVFWIGKLSVFQYFSIPNNLVCLGY